MKAAGLVLAGLRYHARTHAGVVLGSAIGAAVLVGALVVGDSVRASLRQQALQRIGKADAVLASGERLFLGELADRLARDPGGRQTAPALLLDGIASTPDGSRRANAVQVLGVDGRFGALALEPWSGPLPGPGQVLLNERLAAQLAAAPGATVVLRVGKPSAMPRDLLLSQNEELSIGLRVEVLGVVPDAAFGRFGLSASQVPPFNAFLSLAWVQERLDLGPQANLLLTDEPDDGRAQESADAALRESWTLADGQLELRELVESSAVELVSGRVFLDTPVAAAAASLELPSLGVLTYFVNELRHGERSTPYSMVSALGPLGAGAVAAVLPGTDWTSVVPPDLADDEIVVNTWLADDLQAGVGDLLELTYFVIGTQRGLVEETRAFTIRAVVPIEGLAADPSLMPDFPGLSGRDDCRDWDPGIPLDLERIRDEDEAWWDAHRGTPKAFVSLAAGQAMWQSRFGALTSLRVATSEKDDLRAQLRARLDPSALGLRFSDLRGPALAASSAATDFGGLFAGLSLFLIVSALLLTAMLFAFGVEQRAREIGTLLAVGFRRAQVRRLFLGEAAGLALVGAALGSLLGLGYTRLVLVGLLTIWRDAVGATALGLHARPATVLLGASLAFLAALFAILLALRPSFRRPTVELLAGGPADPGERSRPRTRLGLTLVALCLLGTLALTVQVDRSDAQAVAGACFGAGGLVLLAAVTACHLLLARWARSDRAAEPAPTVGSLGLRGCTRRPGRSLATIALLASGTFLVLAIGANRLGLPRDPTLRSSGTGGFALIGTTTLALPEDLETPAGREAYGLEQGELADVHVVPLRVRAGDDASCLNLSLPQRPRLVGVRPEDLASRQAFSFAATRGEPDGASPWLLLEGQAEDGAIPAIADQASVTWSLHKAVGETLEYVDERGRPFEVRIVASLEGSILQGDLLIGERAFERLFPSESGHRMLLVDAPPERADEVAATLGRALADLGLELVPSATRLAEFNAVQNTYLLIFQLLGLLGLLLGSVGIGMVVLRNTLERRSELALLRAVGFGRRSTRWLVLSEHGALLALGLLCGTLAAAVALIPGMLGVTASPSLPAALGMLALVAASGTLWTWLATVLAVRGELLPALRAE